MAITVGTSEPTSFTVGDSVSWTRSETDYLPPFWSLVYGFAGPTRFNITTTDSGLLHLATMPITPGTVKPGQYSWIVRATSGPQHIQTARGTMTALPNLTSANAELDAIEAKIVLAEAAYNSLAIKENVSISVDGISYSKSTANNLWMYVARLRRERTRLISEQRALLGQATGANFRLRFNT